MDLLPIKRAIVSVTDKTGVVDFVAFLVSGGVEIVSTGGTQKVLKEAGIPVTSVEAVTGFPEILNGRVKTLHPKIHGGVLADKDNPDHLRVISEKGIKPFDLVCVNLYDFYSAAERGLSPREAAEEIDIGGPTLLRAAAKNFASVLVTPGVEWYAPAREELEKNGMRVGLEFRQLMASRAFDVTSRYDALISSHLRP